MYLMSSRRIASDALGYVLLDRDGIVVGRHFLLVIVSALVVDIAAP